MKKLNIKIIALLVTLMLTVSAFPFNFITANAATYVRPYLTDLKYFPYYGAEINGPVEGTNNFINGLFIDWTPHGSYSWSNIYISETPICNSNGVPYNFSGQEYDSNNSSHYAAYINIAKYAYALDKNDLAHNVASQSCAYVQNGARFYRTNPNTGALENYYFQHESGKTYYFYIVAVGVDTSGNIIPYISACFEYTSGNTIATIPNGLSNTVKFALVHNDNTGAWGLTVDGFTQGIIYRWDSLAEYYNGGGAASKTWYVTYSRTNGYTVSDISATGNTNDGINVSCTQGGTLNTSYCSFVDTDITASQGEIADYYYMIYQSTTSSPIPVVGMTTTSNAPGPVVIPSVEGMYYDPSTGTTLTSNLPQRLTFDISAIGANAASDTIEYNYRAHYRWTVMGVYTNYINTCKNTTAPDYDVDSQYTHHTGANECGTFHHADPLIARGGRFGEPGVPLFDASGSGIPVTNHDGALEQDGQNYVTTGFNGYAIYDPVDVCFSFGADYNEAPLYIKKDLVFASTESTTVTDCVTGADLTRGATYMFTFTSLYEYQEGEIHPVWQRAITKEDIIANNNGNVNATKFNIFGSTYFEYTVPYISIDGTHYSSGNPTNKPFVGSYFTHSTFSSLHRAQNTPIDVTIAWSDLKFNLVGTWQPESHTYSYGFNAATYQSHRITITNNGLADITVTGQCEIVDKHKGQINCWLYDPLLSDADRYWLSYNKGMDVPAKNTSNPNDTSNTRALNVFVYAPPNTFTRDMAQTFVNGESIASITLRINQKYRLVNDKA